VNPTPMRNTLIVLAITASVVFIGFLSILGSYNGLVDEQETVNQSLGQIQVAYQRRADLIPNLVATAKDYAEFEQKTLQNITEARARATSAAAPSGARDGKLGEYQAAQEQLSASVRQFMVVVENYPNLKANENFRTLMDELAGSENRIAVARKKFNDAAATYNKSVRSFPKNIIAGLFSFGSVPYFEAAAGSDKAPQVKF
jgi:LemA protein